MSLPPVLLKQLFTQMLPKINELLDDAIRKASEVELHEGEATHMIQLWVANEVAYVAGVAVTADGQPVRKIFGPTPLKDYLDADLLKNLKIEDL